MIQLSFLNTPGEALYFFIYFIKSLITVTATLLVISEILVTMILFANTFSSFGRFKGV